METTNPDKIRQVVRQRYGRLAQPTGQGCGCSPSSACCGGASTMVTQIGEAIGYSQEQLEIVVPGANLGLGCGNPHAIGGIKPGEIVLDLGSGGGFDCFLAARAVGATGRVIGVDMTAEMVSKARENAEKMGVDNVEFRLGEIEHLPAADNSVDVIISNCVINLAPDKRQVFREAFRVLKPGGRLAIADVVATAALPDAIKKDLELVSACVGGAEEIEHLESLLAEVGFREVNIQAQSASRELIRQWVPGRNLEDYIVSATIQGVKPA
ncbi:MAG: arsenite methyltransferase [Desulfobacterales bacterium]|nr:MAG: arsenite methyltransferase [Desulfobacterales bacterium]